MSKSRVISEAWPTQCSRSPGYLRRTVSDKPSWSVFYTRFATLELSWDYLLFVPTLLSCLLSLWVSISSSFHMNLSFLPPPPHPSAGQSSLKFFFHRIESWKHWRSWDTMRATCRWDWRSCTRKWGKPRLRRARQFTFQKKLSNHSPFLLTWCLTAARWIYTDNINCSLSQNFSRNSKMPSAIDFWHSHHSP